MESPLGPVSGDPIGTQLSDVHLLGSGVVNFPVSQIVSYLSYDVTLLISALNIRLKLLANLTNFPVDLLEGNRDFCFGLHTMLPAHWGRADRLAVYIFDSEMRQRSFLQR